MMENVVLEFTEWQRTHLKNTISVLPDDQRSPFQKWAQLVKLVNGEILNQYLVNNDELFDKTNIPTGESMTASALWNDNLDDMMPPVLSPIARNSDEVVDSETQPPNLTPVNSTNTTLCENFDEIEPPSLTSFTQAISSENLQNEMEPPALQPMALFTANSETNLSEELQMAPTTSVTEAPKDVKQVTKLRRSIRIKKLSTHTESVAVKKPVIKPNTPKVAPTQIPLKGRKLESNKSSSNAEPPKRLLRTRTNVAAPKLPLTHRTIKQGLVKSSPRIPTSNSTEDRGRPDTSESKKKRERAKVPSSASMAKSVADVAGRAGVERIPSESFARIHTGVSIPRVLKEQRSESTVNKPSTKRTEPVKRKLTPQNQSKAITTTARTNKNNLKQTKPSSSSSSIPPVVSAARPRSNQTAKRVASSSTTTTKRLGPPRATEKNEAAKKILVPISRIPKGQKSDPPKSQKK